MYISNTIRALTTPLHRGPGNDPGISVLIDRLQVYMYVCVYIYIYIYIYLSIYLSILDRHVDISWI